MFYHEYQWMACNNVRVCPSCGEKAEEIITALYYNGEAYYPRGTHKRRQIGLKGPPLYKGKLD
jgi:hypothetical protein